MPPRWSRSGAVDSTGSCVAHPLHQPAQHPEVERGVRDREVLRELLHLELGGLRLVAAGEEAPPAGAHVDRGVHDPHDGQLRPDPFDRLRDEHLVARGDHRHVDPRAGGDLTRPGPGRVDHDRAVDPSPIRFDAAHRAVPDVDPGDRRARKQRRAQLAGGGRVAAGDVGGLEVDVARSMKDRPHPVGPEERVHPMRRFRRDDPGLETELLAPAGLARERLRVLGRPRRLQTPRPDDLQGLARIGGEPEEPFHGAARQPAHQVGRAQHGGVAGRAGRGLRGEGVPVQQDDPAAAAAHQEVGGGGAEAARPDHDDICIANHPVPPTPGGAAPPGGGGAALSSPRFVDPPGAAGSAPGCIPAARTRAPAPCRRA